LDDYLILIIDDDQTQHLILGEYLKSLGYEVAHAIDGAHGLKIMEAQKPDLILLDVQMPVMDGFKTLELIREKSAFRDTPVLMLTSLARETLKIKGLELGADDYITKPFNKAELIARVKAALRRVVRNRRTEGLMEGNLSDLGLADLLQSMELGSKTASIFLTAMNGEIFIEKGYLISVRQGGFTRDEALTRIFLLEKGAFSVRFNYLPPDVSKEDPRPLMSVLMGVLANVDEIKDIIRRIGVENRLIKTDPDPSEFPQLEKFKDMPPLSFTDLLVLMEGDLKKNLKTLILASKKGKIKIVKP
jgi:DNA-binding response OmpR family regulator